MSVSGAPSNTPTPPSGGAPSFFEILQNIGVFPDPMTVLTDVGKSISEYKVYDFAVLLGVIIFLTITFYRVMNAALTLRPRIAAEGILRGLLVGAALTAYPYIRDGTLYLWNGAYHAGIAVGSRMMDSALSDNYLLDFMGLATGGMALSAARLGGEALKVGAEKLLRSGIGHGVEKGGQQIISGQAAQKAKNAMGNTAVQGVETTLRYLNIFGILLVPLMLSMVAMGILSGMLILLANVAFPALIATLMASPQTGAAFFSRWVQAFVGSFSTAFLTPIIYGSAAIIALKSPAQKAWEKIDRLLQKLSDPLANYGLFEITAFLKDVGALIWSFIAFAIALGISIWVGWLLVQAAGRYITQITSGSIAGGGLGEALGTIMLFKAASRIANRPGSVGDNLAKAGTNLAETAARTGWETTKHMMQPAIGAGLWGAKAVTETAKYLAKEAGKEGAPSLRDYLRENVGPVSRYIPRRTTSQHSLTDYIIRRTVYGMDPDTAYEGIRMPTPEEREKRLMAEMPAATTGEAGVAERGWTKLNPATIRPLKGIEGVEARLWPPSFQVKVKRDEVTLPAGNREPLDQPTVGLTGLNRVEESALQSKRDAVSPGASLPPESPSKPPADGPAAQDETEKAIRDLIPGKAASEVKKTPEPERKT